MVNCSIISIVALTSALFGGGCRGRPASEPLAVGSRVPAGWAEAGNATSRKDNVFVVWLFRTDDCLNCQNFDYALRRMAAEHGDNVPFVGVHVGNPRDIAVPRGFFQERRIPVHALITVKPRDFDTSRIRDWYIPGLYVVQDDRVVWAASKEKQIGQQGTVDMIVAGLLGDSSAEALPVAGTVKP